MAAKIVVRRYKNDRQYEGDARRLARKGYQVLSVTSQTPRRNFFGFLMLGLFSRQPELVVTYQLIPTPPRVTK